MLSPSFNSATALFAFALVCDLRDGNWAVGWDMTAGNSDERREMMEGDTDVDWDVAEVVVSDMSLDVAEGDSDMGWDVAEGDSDMGWEVTAVDSDVGWEVTAVDSAVGWEVMAVDTRGLGSDGG